MIGNRFNTYKILYDSLSDPLTREILNRADIDINVNNLKDLGVFDNTLPQYNVAGLRNIVIYATEAAIKTDSRQIEIAHFVIALFKAYPVLQKILQENKISTEILEESTKYLLEEIYKKEHYGFFDLTRPYYKNGGIARNWIYGWTFILGHFSSDVNEKVSLTQETFGIGHKKEIDALISSVGKLTNNKILLTGEPGTGKSSIIKGLAQRINKGDVPVQLKNKRIVQFDLNGLIATASNNKNLEQLVLSAMKELSNAGNTILYIDEIQELIPAKAEKSGHSIAGIMLPYILESNFSIVGTINYADYKKYFYSNASLKNSFDTIEVAELSPEDTLVLLTEKIQLLESNFGVYIPLPALMASIEFAQRYIHNRKLPDSAVNVLEATCSWAQTNNISRITSEHVAKVVSIQYGIPVKSIDSDEATQLMKLEETIKSRVIGQDQAVHLIVETLKRSRTDIRDPNKPIGVFLFLGPTGVGKTYLAKVIAQEYFDRGEDIIRVDMSEYQEVSSISKFLDTGSEGEMTQHKISLIDRVKSNPYSVVLFDEIEKAHPNILNLFLQLFDEGRLTSNLGETVSFRNAVIICTSNIGSRILLESLEKEQSMWSEAKDRAIIELRQAISPELYNRFDEIVVFSPHDVTKLTTIAQLQLNELAERMQKKGIMLDWDKTLPMLIANKAYEPGFGARPIKRYIQKNIEGKIATELIEKKTKAGETITIRESWIK
jgi:ATP-dependent Clp protease ATP-binding subunit ClpC